MGGKTQHYHHAHSTGQASAERIYRALQQNGTAGMVRQEWLGRYIFETIQEVQDQATRWLWTYNNERPNMGIGGITPIQKLKMAA